MYELNLHPLWNNKRLPLHRHHFFRKNGKQSGRPRPVIVVSSEASVKKGTDRRTALAFRLNTSGGENIKKLYLQH